MHFIKYVLFSKIIQIEVSIKQKIDKKRKLTKEEEEEEEEKKKKQNWKCKKHSNCFCSNDPKDRYQKVGEDSEEFIEEINCSNTLLK